MNIVSFLFRTVFQLRVRNKSVDQLINQAVESGSQISTQLAQKADTPQNRQQLRHIIGIERWGQSRLRTILGAPLVQDEYDGYQPPPTLDFNALRAEFAATRAATIALAQEIQKNGVAESGKALHNGMGEIPLTVWLGYLTGHAALESKRIR